jgi:hypothetical protein
MSDFEFTSPGISDESEETVSSVASPSPLDPTWDDEGSLLSRLKSKLKQEIRRSDVLLPVPERPGVSVRFSPNVTNHQVRRWRKMAGDETKKGLDGTLFACHLLGNTCTGILIDGELVTEEGHAVTFASDTILSWLGVDRPIPDGIRAFYGVDPHVDAAGFAILEAAGFSDDIEPEGDPTKTS